MTTRLRCNKCHRSMTGTTAYDGACACGGLIEAVPGPILEERPFTESYAGFGDLDVSINMQPCQHLDAMPVDPERRVAHGVYQQTMACPTCKVTYVAQWERTEPADVARGPDQFRGHDRAVRKRDPKTF